VLVVFKFRVPQRRGNYNQLIKYKIFKEDLHYRFSYLISGLWDVEVWTGVIWLRIGTVGGHLKM